MKRLVFCALVFCAGIAMAAFDVRDFGASKKGQT